MNAFPERPTPPPRFTLTPADLEPLHSLQEASRTALRERMLQDERRLRRLALPLFAEGYRVTDLHIVEHRDRFYTAVPSVILPRRRVATWRLWMRRQWRRVRPYRLPGVTDVPTV